MIFLLYKHLFLLLCYYNNYSKGINKISGKFIFKNKRIKGLIENIIKTNPLIHIIISNPVSKYGQVICSSNNPQTFSQNNKYHL